jgi:DNA-binding HxlR family transcriptional regulator
MEISQIKNTKPENPAAESPEQTSYNCPVDTAIAMIGGKYKSLILWHLIDATLRFGELRKLIPQATPKMLTQQLRELERDNLVARTVYPVVPPKVEYRLTDLGRSIRPILLSMYEWGADYLAQKGLEVNCSMTVPASFRP